MKLKTVISLAICIGAFSAFAGPKEDFMKAVEAAKCEKKIEPKGGRQGNVMKWKTCTSTTITIEGCAIKCPNAANSIGG
jgi:hypothetical protein